MSDHPNYDNQIIIQFLNGDRDHVITGGTEKLTQKAQNNLRRLPTVIVQIKGRHQFLWPKEKNRLREAFKSCGARTRIYLRGHGDWQFQTLGGWNPQQVASVLHTAGLKTAKVISVVGCGLGVDKGVLALNTPAANVGRNVSADSFASNLHRTLGEKYLIFTDVVARTGNVTIGEDGKKSVFHYDGQYPGDVQEKGKRPVPNPIREGGNKAADSKIVYKWVDQQQKRYNAYAVKAAANLDEVAEW